MSKNIKKSKIGQFYDRDEIHEMFGGSKQAALPYKGGVPVCGCYTLEINPDAPEVILVGIGMYKERYSRMAAERNIVLPIFLKHAVGEFKFNGHYQAIRYSIDRNEIEEHNSTDRPHTSIAGVLYFEEAKTV